jgi:microcystin degradation protein MlrC
VTSTNHFYAAFGPTAAQVLYCDGRAPPPSIRATTRSPLWPNDELPDGEMVL